jgi:lysophospholipase L1-like esterase
VALVALVLAPPAAAAPALDYIALGDSIASGHGLLDRGGNCRRSPRAYPHTVLAELRERHDRVRFVMLACSGAVASSEPDGLRSFKRQVSAALGRIGTRPTLVSITIGINDFAWSDIVASYYRIRDPDTASFEGWVDATVHRVAEALAAQLKRLLARPKVVVVLTDYHNPVNTASLLFAGPAPCADKAACYARTEYLVHELNAALRDLTRRRVRLAAVHQSFHGHEGPSPTCGSSPPSVESTWVQHPDDPDSNSFPPEAALLGEVWRGDCFHPNALGAGVIGRAVSAAARAAGR